MRNNERYGRLMGLNGLVERVTGGLFHDVGDIHPRALPAVIWMGLFNGGANLLAERGGAPRERQLRSCVPLRVE